VLLEFKEYATEVDVDFVRKAVRAIGYCAISIQSAAERCGGSGEGLESGCVALLALDVLTSWWHLPGPVLAHWH
jgi:hypothetical protein